MKSFTGNRECGIKMCLKLTNRKVKFQKLFGGYTPRTPASGEGEGRAGKGRTGGEGEGRRVGPPTFETVPPPLMLLACLHFTAKTICS